MSSLFQFVRGVVSIVLSILVVVRRRSASQSTKLFLESLETRLVPTVLLPILKEQLGLEEVRKIIPQNANHTEVRLDASGGDRMVTNLETGEIVESSTWANQSFDATFSSPSGDSGSVGTGSSNSTGNYVTDTGDMVNFANSSEFLSLGNTKIDTQGTALTVGTDNSQGKGFFGIIFADGGSFETKRNFVSNGDSTDTKPVNGTEIIVSSAHTDTNVLSRNVSVDGVKTIDKDKIQDDAYTTQFVFASGDSLTYGAQFSVMNGKELTLYVNGESKLRTDAQNYSAHTVDYVSPSSSTEDHSASSENHATWTVSGQNGDGGNVIENGSQDSSSQSHDATSPASQSSTSEYHGNGESQEITWYVDGRVFSDNSGNSYYSESSWTGDGEGNGSGKSDSNSEWYVSATSQDGVGNYSYSVSGEIDAVHSDTIGIEGTKTETGMDSDYVYSADGSYGPDWKLLSQSNLNVWNDTKFVSVQNPDYSGSYDATTTISGTGHNFALDANGVPIYGTTVVGGNAEEHQSSDVSGDYSYSKKKDVAVISTLSDADGIVFYNETINFGRSFTFEYTGNLLTQSSTWYVDGTGTLEGNPLRVLDLPVFSSEGLDIPDVSVSSGDQGYSPLANSSDNSDEFDASIAHDLAKWLEEQEGRTF